MAPFPYTVNGQHYYFVPVNGLARGVPNLVACMIDQASNTPYAGVPMRQGMHWIIGFSLPPNNNARYHLLVGQTGAQGGNLATTDECTIGPANVLRAAIPITYPAAGATLCSNFTAYGSLVGGNNATGATMESNNNTYNGTAVTQGVPPGMWMFEFTNLPDGDDYVFTVTDAAGNTASVANLTVDAGSCTIITAPPPPGL